MYMLIVFTGNDVVRVRAEAQAYLEEKEKELGKGMRISVDSYVPGIFIECSETQSLFGGVGTPVLFDFLSEDGAIYEEWEKFLEVFSASSRLFVLMDQKQVVAREKVLKKYATIFSAIEGKDTSPERFNTFLLADAFLKKDKKTLWLLLMRARRAGVSSEEVLGTLFWQVKSVRLAQGTHNAEEAGMKDFTYRKAKAVTRTFTKEELEKISETLLTLYHDGHFGMDMDVGLEKFVLRF